ncbi:MAG: hypothetical protein ACKPKO_23510 [Candidatus Fonsibacter sp.]
MTVALAAKSDSSDVNYQLALKANQLTTYTKNRGRHSIRAQGESINHIHENRGRRFGITEIRQDLCRYS